MKPILFSTPMVQAILEGRKTMTRRILKNVALNWIDRDGFSPDFVARKDNGLSPFGYSGDILWVRETWKPARFAGESLTGYDYKSDHVSWLEKNNQGFTKNSGCEKGEHWKPSIFMPKEACRLYLEITSIMVELLQDISELDAILEGIDLNKVSGDFEKTPSCVFHELWSSINGEESWEANPWVWVIEFKKIDKLKP